MDDFWKELGLSQKLQCWIETTCENLKNPSPTLSRLLNRILIDIYNDPQFKDGPENWRKYNCDPQTFADALSNMWTYFTNNLCTPSRYSQSGRSFWDTAEHAVPRLIRSLRGHILNRFVYRQQQQERRAFRRDETGQPIDARDYLADTNFIPDVDTDQAKQEAQALLRLLQQDPLGELTSEQNTLRGQNDTYVITLQDYLIARFIEGLSRPKIAEKFGVNKGTLNDKRRYQPWEAFIKKYMQMARESIR